MTERLNAHFIAAEDALTAVTGKDLPRDLIVVHALMAIGHGLLAVAYALTEDKDEIGNPRFVPREGQGG